jgi:hypothetical protein
VSHPFPHFTRLQPLSSSPTWYRSPWTGKCIGRRNLRFFYAFLWSLLALILFVAACVFGLILMRTVFAAPSSPPAGG